MVDAMQAVVVRAPMEFGVETVPKPEVPAGGFLLAVKVSHPSLPALWI